MSDFTDQYEDWEDTLGGQLARLEAKARELGASDVLAGIDQIRAKNREATEHMISEILGWSESGDQESQTSKVKAEAWDEDFTKAQSPERK